MWQAHSQKTQCPSLFLPNTSFQGTCFFLSHTRFFGAVIYTNCKGKKRTRRPKGLCGRRWFTKTSLHHPEAPFFGWFSARGYVLLLERIQQDCQGNLKYLPGTTSHPFKMNTLLKRIEQAKLFTTKELQKVLKPFIPSAGVKQPLSWFFKQYYRLCFKKKFKFKKYICLEKNSCKE